ncbi:MAG TPA: group II intron reverse transcriptase/maturase [Micromonosporaceae bacterium]|nr:group II intron reverse transcriptase/maturase [Micromonosporaceae bacterium]
MNTGVPWPEVEEAEARVLRIQTKLHQWATDDPGRRFDDLYNLVADPAVLVVAWTRVRGNRGKRSAGVDRVRPDEISSAEEEFLPRLRADLKARQFTPLPVRQRMIPKPGTSKRRRLGIPTARDRTVQAALKLVLEPIFEVDFKPCSYGFRPRRRAHDAIAEIHQFASRSYEWVLEGDIEACFDMIDHPALMDRVRRRVGDKRVLALVKAFLRSGILGEDGRLQNTVTGTPQGGILSPLLANVALSVLDEHFAEAWQAAGATSYHRFKRRQAGLATYRLVRYADDFVVLVAGTEAHAADLREEVAAVLAPMGLRLSEAKTRVCHIDEGFDFLGFRIQRRRKRGTDKRVVYTYPAKKALASIVDRVRALTRRSSHPTLAVLLRQLNPVLRGWCTYFRHGVSKATFGYLDQYTWHRVVRWICKRHNRTKWAILLRRYLPGWRPTEDGVTLFVPQQVTVSRYRYRAANIPTPWPSRTPGSAA